MSNNCHTEKKVKARVMHKCVECNCIISQGQMYRRESGIYEAKPFSVALCVFCKEIMLAAIHEIQPYEDELPNYGDLGEWILDSFDHDSNQAIAKSLDVDIKKVNRLLGARDNAIN